MSSRSSRLSGKKRRIRHGIAWVLDHVPSSRHIVDRQKIIRDGYSASWGVYLLSRPEDLSSKYMAIYTRCEVENYCRAEILLQIDSLKTSTKLQEATEGRTVVAVYDIDPTYTKREFLQKYKPMRLAAFNEKLAQLTNMTWPYPLLFGSELEGP